MSIIKHVLSTGILAATLTATAIAKKRRHGMSIDTGRRAEKIARAEQKAQRKAAMRAAKKGPP